MAVGSRAGPGDKGKPCLVFKLHKKSSFGPRLRDSQFVCPDPSIRVLGISVSTALRCAGSIGSWRPFLGKPKALSITAMLSKHLLHARILSFHIIATSWAGVIISFEQMSNFLCKSPECPTQVTRERKQNPARNPNYFDSKFVDLLPQLHTLPSLR